MDRRTFLKSVGTLAVSAQLQALAGEQQLRDSNKRSSSNWIVGEADERIEKYRKRHIVLRLRGPSGETLPTGMPVLIEQKQHKFLFGCNIFKLGRCRTARDNELYEQHFAALLNYATLPFYWWAYTRQRGKPDDARTEFIVRWCRVHDVTPKGHPLAWNWAEPAWLPDDPEKAMKEQLQRIARCVGRFKGQINIWDVVNEATHYDRDKAKRDAPKLTEAIRRMGVGQYVREAFRAARQANPSATLIINDYRTDPAYARKVLSKLVDADGRAMYDVIGIQSHMHGGYWGPQRTWEVCERFARFGKPLHFTETTITSGPRTSQGWYTTAEGEQKQAQQVTEFYRVLFSHPAVEAITWWDFSDQGAWQGAPAGLVRTDMSPKPAYEALKELIKGKWWTKLHTRIARKGTVRLHGFLGRYQVATLGKGPRLAGTFELDKSSPDLIELKLS